MKRFRSFSLVDQLAVLLPACVEDLPRPKGLLSIRGRRSTNPSIVPPEASDGVRISESGRRLRESPISIAPSCRTLSSIDNGLRLHLLLYRKGRFSTKHSVHGAWQKPWSVLSKVAKTVRASKILFVRLGVVKTGWIVCTRGGYHMTRRALTVAAAVLFLVNANPAQAVISFDQNVTPDVIFGSGNANGGFTVDRANGIELGLRGKLRFDAANQPQNIFNSNGDGTYSFDNLQAPSGFSFAQPPTTTPIWNFEWSINTNFDDSAAGRNLNDLVYILGIDFDPSPATNFLSFDPINQSLADHAIGDNSTGNAGGSKAANATEYGTLIDSNNVAQNSWNMEFFNNAPFDTFNPTDEGTYRFFLSAQDSSQQELARVEIDIVVGAATQVSEPGTLALLAFGLAGLGFLYRRKKT